jgi:hypothetical protein
MSPSRHRAITSTEFHRQPRFDEPQNPNHLNEISAFGLWAIQLRSNEARTVG